MQNALIRDIWNEVIAKGHTSPAKVKEIVERHLGKQVVVDESKVIRTSPVLIKKIL